MNKEFDSLMRSFDERDRRFDRLENLIWGLYALFILVLASPWIVILGAFAL